MEEPLEQPLEEPVLDLERLPAAVKLATKTTQIALLSIQKAAASWALGVTCGMTKSSISSIGEECMNVSRKCYEAGEHWSVVGRIVGFRNHRNHKAVFSIYLDISKVGEAWTKAYFQLLNDDMEWQSSSLSFISAFKAFEETIDACERMDSRMAQIALAFPEIKVEMHAVASTVPYLTNNVAPLLDISAVSGYVFLTSKLNGCFA